MSMETASEEALRERAVKRLKKKRYLAAHALIYCLVNGFIVAIWLFTGHGFFWPIFPIVGWGIGLVMNVWDVYRGDELDEAEIRREIERLQRRG